MRIHHELTRPWLMALMACLAILLGAPASAQLETLTTGMKGPALSVSDLDGRLHDQDEFVKAGFTTVLLFWAPDNRKSPDALKALENVKAKHQDKPLIILNIAVQSDTAGDSGLAAVRETADRLGLKQPVYVDIGRVVFQEYGVIALPTTVIIDADRTILYALAGWPLVGSEQMLDFLTATIQGKSPEATVASPSGPRPDKNAVRHLNLARKTAAKRTMASAAVPLFEQAIAADPSFVLPYLELSDLQFCEHDLVGARSTLDRGASAVPNNPLILSRLGRLLVDEGKSDEALAALKRAVELNPTSPHARIMLAYALSKAGRMAEAEEAFKQAIELNPYIPDIYGFRAYARFEGGNLKDSTADYRTLLNLLLKP